MTDRREVRVTDQFFDRLDELLPSERSIYGDPSTADFLLHEMPSIIDRLASDYDAVTIPAVPGSDVRILITSGVFVRAVAVYVAQTPEGWIDVFYLDID